jgi:hypothetical protein
VHGKICLYTSSAELLRLAGFVLCLPGYPRAGDHRPTVICSLHYSYNQLPQHLLLLLPANCSTHFAFAQAPPYTWLHQSYNQLLLLLHLLLLLLLLVVILQAPLLLYAHPTRLISLQCLPVMHMSSNVAHTP